MATDRVLSNQTRILANQTRIERNQKKLDMIIKNQRELSPTRRRS
jgi:hypothetical protein